MTPAIWELHKYLYFFSLIIICSQVKEFKEFNTHNKAMSVKLDGDWRG